MARDTDQEDTDHKAAIQDALDRAHVLGLNQITSMKFAAFSTMSTMQLNPIRQPCGSRSPYGHRALWQPMWDFDAERPATPDELNEMGEYSRRLAHREPTGSEATGPQRRTVSAACAKPNGKTPRVTVPAEN